MRTKTILLASSAVAALTLAAPAEAAGNFYVTAFGGVNYLNDEAFAVATVPTGSYTFLFSSDPDVGWIVGGAVGASLDMLVPGLRGEVEASYREQNVDGFWASTTPVTGTYGALDYDQSTFAVMANLWYDFDLVGFRPYVGGGVGWARTELDGTYTTAGLVVVPLNFDDNGFAWQLGAGINFDISPNVMLGVGYRYFDGPEVRVASPFPLANPLTSDIESQNHSAIVSLTFKM